MKRTISILALAAPLATVALSLGATPALAETPPAPGINTTLAIQPEVDPPLPPGPDDKVGPEGPTDPDPGPGPGDGPGDLTSNPCPTHGCGNGPGDEDEKDPGDDSSTGDFTKPNRIDAGAGGTEDGTDIAWVLTGALVTASGAAAYAARRRDRSKA